ncbi:MAG: rhodanese-like domain-containing protein, partial [Deltaproteobacteria bacterium]|nr:rhodanese-like domain-containing protein [Deltaproteobacteria bacterium]
IKGRMKGISAVEVKRKLGSNTPPFFLDVRESIEFERMRLGIGETLISLGALRKRLTELPEDREKEIICFCQISLRAYEASLVLEDAGWKNVSVMEGGVAAWPYPREK